VSGGAPAATLLLSQFRPGFDCNLSPFVYFIPPPPASVWPTGSRPPPLSGAEINVWAACGRVGVPGLAASTCVFVVLSSVGVWL